MQARAPADGEHLTLTATHPERLALSGWRTSSSRGRPSSATGAAEARADRMAADALSGGPIGAPAN